MKILIWFPVEIVLINKSVIAFSFVQLPAKIPDEKQSCSPPSFLFLLIISIDNFPSMNNKRLTNKKFAIDWILTPGKRVCKTFPARRLFCRLFSTIAHPFIVITHRKLITRSLFFFLLSAQFYFDSSKWWIFFVPSSKVTFFSSI